MRIIVLQATRSASQAAAEWTMDSWTLVPSAAVAATFAGMLSALSGIGGPPLILMFELLEVPKVSSAKAVSLQCGAFVCMYIPSAPNHMHVLFSLVLQMTNVWEDCLLQGTLEYWNVAGQ